MSKSKKHHYVPQSILRNFSIDNNEGQIYVFDKKSENSFRSSIQDAGSENYFNTVETPFGKLNLEDLFQHCDNITASIVRKIIDAETLDKLEFEDFYQLSLAVAIQFNRTKLVRTTLDYVSKEQERVIKDLCEKSPKFNFNQKKNRAFTDEEIKLISILGAFDVDDLLKNLLSRGIYIVRNCTNFPFWISDNPVVVHNSFPYGSDGISSKGTEVIYPISSKFAVVFSCKTILEKIETTEKTGLLDDIGIRYLKAVKDNITMDIFEEHSEHVEFYNQQQVLNSSRFVYSSINDFSLVEETITAIPGVKELKSKIKIGEMGKGPPPNPNLPMGAILVVYGKKTHYMISVKNLLIDVEVEFTAIPNMAFGIMINDTPFERVEIYVDQQMRKLLGNPKIVPMDLQNGIFKITHSEKGLVDLLKKLANERKSL